MENGKQRLVAEAIGFKKAWILAAIWLGRGVELSSDDLMVPDYQKWPRRNLQREVPLLRDDFSELWCQIVEQPDAKKIQSAAKWMAAQLDQWRQSGGGIATLCTARDFEFEFGLLAVRSAIEVPPYSELLMQGLHSVAVRHPEYMLARDLEFLYSLFLHCESSLEDVNWRAMPSWAGSASENSQALARAVMQACFNLLESFISGIARGYQLENSEVPAEIVKKLTDQTKSLKQRIVLVPELITGVRCGLDPNSPPLSRLFVIKLSRDSFVHCEPGQQVSPKTGLVKETLFHDVSKALVDETVSLTSSVICHIWRAVFVVDGPRWLPDLTVIARKPAEEPQKPSKSSKPS